MDDLEGTMQTSTPAQRAVMEALGAVQDLTENTTTVEEAASGVWCMKLVLANLCFVRTGADTSDSWILVDAGLPGAARHIQAAATQLFGEGSRPQAIILTHGHFDHVGSVIDLAKRWDVPVYAHEKELPYLQGEADYPPGDPTVSPGMLAKLSPLYPNKGIDLGSLVQPLPGQSRVPFADDWQWIHTPGHTPGHISLLREIDGVLIAGDAFTTTAQESALSVATQQQEVHSPPKYFTPDWSAARDSVRHLASLHPQVAVTGHGEPMKGEELANQLKRLADYFSSLAVPSQGRYV